MNNNQIECSDCGEIYEESELESCMGCEEDFCDDCLNVDGYCSECE